MIAERRITNVQYYGVCFNIITRCNPSQCCCGPADDNSLTRHRHIRRPSCRRGAVDRQKRVARGVNGASSLSGICCHCHSSIPVSEYSRRFTIQLEFLLHIIHFPCFILQQSLLITRETHCSKSLNVHIDGILV
jgi:hypothetical protein